MKKIFILLTGPPNSGKTTLAKELNDVLPNSFLVETDWELVKLILDDEIEVDKDDYGKRLGQITNLLNDDEKEKYKKTLKKSISSAYKNHKITITEGYSWEIPFYYEEIIKEYEEKENCFFYRFNLNYNDFYSANEIKNIIKTKSIENIILPSFGMYQQFDFLTFNTSSRTGEKLNALELPEDMSGKRILDIGCNNGFFAIECARRGAANAIGIDNDARAIDVAASISTLVYFLSNANFKVVDITNDSETSLLGKFDLILALSMFHYMNNQENLFKKLFSLLNNNGILKLEMGISPKQENIIENISGKNYPTLSKIKEWIATINHKNYKISPSVNQAGDSIPRFVLTVWT